jgi:hypothetical protein
MPLSSVSQKFVDDFFAAIAPFEKAFGHAEFSYLAVKLGSDLVVWRGRVFLSSFGLVRCRRISGLRMCVRATTSWRNSSWMFGV